MTKSALDTSGPSTLMQDKAFKQARPWSPKAVKKSLDSQTRVFTPAQTLQRKGSLRVKEPK